MEVFTASDRPEIEYPCLWDYTTIGPSQHLMRAAIAQILPGGEYRVELSKLSANGKYCSLALQVTVNSEDHRNQIFSALSQHQDIIMVL